MAKNKSKELLFEEIEELRIRLKEAEETLGAIRSGEVDAIVVSGLQGEQVFTLTGAERAYRVLIETMNEGAVSLNQKGMIIYCNRRFSEMINTPLEKVIGSPMRQFVRASDLRVFDSLLEKRSQENGKGEIAFINNAGTVLPVLLSISALQKDDANIYGITVTDLTAQKRVEEELRRHRDNFEELVKDRTIELEASNQQLETEIAGRKQKEDDLQRLNRTLKARNESSNAMMSAINEEGYLNEVCRIIVEDCGHALVWIGYAEHDEDRTVRSVAHAGFEEGYLETMKITWTDTERGRGPVGTAIRTGKPVVFRSTVSDSRFEPWRKEALKRGYAAVVAIPLLAEGKPIGSLNLYSRDQNPFPEDEVQLFVDLATDLSYGIVVIRQRIAQAEAESALRESEERFRQIAESTEEWIWEVDRDGLYTYGSNVVKKILGYEPEELVGKKHFFDLFPSHKREQMKKESLESFAAKKVVKKYVNANVHKNGSIILIETSGSPILDGSGNLQGYRGVDIDITGYRKLEDQLRHAQKMEAVGTLAGGIAHDFNNILNVIMGYGAMVMDGLEIGSPAKERMNEVLLAADRAANLTKRLLVFSRKQIVEVKPVNINELILDLQKMLVRIIRENIDFKLDLADRPLIVQADAGQIEQVLMNLASNAKDAMLEGGHLTIGTGVQELDDEYVAAYGYGQTGTYALITLADTGQGMDAETQKKIFEPFFTTKGIGEGTGLGLAISYGIVKQHNGFIKVYSEPGKGTIFRIYLPLVQETAGQDKKVEVVVPVLGGNETILVAEDDASLRKLKTLVLESFGYNVVSAEDGEDAIAKFMKNREKIQIAILDMIMPKKNGKEVSEAIRKVSPRTKILFTSGYTMDIIKTKELAEAGFDFLLKPISSKDLLRKVREVLDK